MNGRGSHKPPSLFVVKGSETPRRISGMEGLSEEQRTLVEEYTKISMSEGVIVGVLHGKAPWDLRPLLLSQGRISILRFSDPTLSSCPDIESRFSTLLKILDVEKQITAAITVGRSGTQHWTRRIFFDETLDDLLRSGHWDVSLKHDALVRALILETARMHRSGLTHGHLSASNTALVDGLPCFFDFGYLTATPSYTAYDSAPEIQAGGFATHASDIFGLGVLLRHLIPQPYPQNISGYLDRMVSNDPGLRPSVEEVRLAFNASDPESGRTSGVRGTLLRSPSVHEIPGSSPLRDAPSGITHASPAGEGPIRSGGVMKYLFFMAVAAFLIAGVVQLRILLRDDAGTQLKYQEYWSSGQPSLMRIVADAAVMKGDRLAQAVIIRTTIGSGRRVISDLFRVAFDPRWEEQLSDQDREMVLGIGLEKIMQYEMGRMPNLADLHPGVILALVASLNLESEGRQFADVPVGKMVSLPGQIGPAFSNLLSENVENMEELPARAVSHIVTGDVTQQSLAAYFRGCDEIPLCLVRLAGIVPLSASMENFDITLYNKLPVVAPMLQPFLSWFTDEDLAQWSSLRPSVRLMLLTGQFPEEGLSVEQVADLVRFPLPLIRQRAMEKLVDDFGLSSDLKSFLEVLGGASKDQTPTRAQSISLISLMLAKGDRTVSFMEQWFSTSPPPQLVLQLLTARPQVDDTDSFSLEAARYLAGKTWNATVGELDQLVQHSEPFVRALAYSKLRLDSPEEIQILQRMVEVEPNQKYRELIRQRLQSAALLAPR